VRARRAAIKTAGKDAEKGAGFIFLSRENKPGTFFPAPFSALASPDAAYHPMMPHAGCLLYAHEKPGDGTQTESYVWPL